MSQHVELASERLTQKQEDFARYVVEHGNATTAYRLAYDCNVAKASGAWVHVEAGRTLRIPSVASRVEELREAAAAVTIVAVRDMVRELHDIATHDAAEIFQVATYNCRHCHGLEGRYEWANEREYLEAAETANELVLAGVKRVKQPDPLGGFGWKLRRPVNPDCVACLGAGHVVMKITDTEQLTGRQRKALKSVKQTASGIEVTTHDKMAAVVEVLKLLGGYTKDNTLNPAAPAQPVPVDATEAEAAQGYMQMLS